MKTETNSVYQSRRLRIATMTADSLDHAVARSSHRAGSTSCHLVDIATKHSPRKRPAPRAGRGAAWLIKPKASMERAGCYGDVVYGSADRDRERHGECDGSKHRNRCGDALRQHLVRLSVAVPAGRAVVHRDPDDGDILRCAWRATEAGLCSDGCAVRDLEGRLFGRR
jgi:hypothetical protein